MSAKFDNDQLFRLLSRVGAGDDKAMDLLYRDRGPMLRRRAEFLGIRVDDLDDFMQDLMFQIWKSAGNFRGDSSVNTFLHSILNNVRGSYFEKKSALKISRKADDDISDVLDDKTGKYRDSGVSHQNESDEFHLLPDRRLENEDQFRLLNVLSDEQKRVMLLVVEGLKSREIAEVEGIPEGTVKSRINKARTILKQLKEHESDQQR